MKRAPGSRRPALRPVARAAKVSITIDAGVLRETKASARRAGRTLSAQVTEALARDLRRQRLARLIAEYEADAGVITEAEMERARAAWRG
jgi:hypothetical protein